VIKGVTDVRVKKGVTDVKQLINLFKAATTNIYFKISVPAIVNESPFDGNTYKIVQHLL